MKYLFLMNGNNLKNLNKYHTVGTDTTSNCAFFFIMKSQQRG